VVLNGDSEEIDRFATNPAAPRIFDLSELPPYLPPDQLEKAQQPGPRMGSSSLTVRLQLPLDKSWGQRQSCHDRLYRPGTLLSPEQHIGHLFVTTELF
jgi:hypothetical protein